MGDRAIERWNHNLHYHGWILAAIPPSARRALDVGCGQGQLAHRLGALGLDVTGIDADAGAIAAAQTAGSGIGFLHGDILTAQLEDESFDFISVVATLHHLPLRPALWRLHALLKPGGVLAVVGLYRMSSPLDYATASIAMPLSVFRRWRRGEEPVGAPMADPRETLAELLREFASSLPGGVLQRRLFFRYTYAWRKAAAG